MYILFKGKGAKKWAVAIKGAKGLTKKEARERGDKIRRGYKYPVQSRIVSEKRAKELIGKKKATKGSQGHFFRL